MRVIILLTLIAVAKAAPDGEFHPLLPGISAEPLPVDLPNCNNVQYRHDGKLVALGYAGDIYLLSDTDGDGAEDQVEMFFESKGNITGQIGMDLAPEGSPHGNAVFIAAKGKVLMIADQDGDDRAEIVQTLAEGWPPARAGVDVTGLALHPTDGSVWFGLGVRLYNDAYEIEETGTAQNDLSSDRGAIFRIAPDFKSREKICTGIRWPIALRFSEHGDLFCTDQEGATWLPNGNPFDELLHIQRGRHYGFPPRHPRHLPGVIDEPSVYDYGPQHQSTCGMNFNSGFGPAWWHGDALVAGESRGKIYRTKLVKTDHGYVAHNEIIAGLGLMIIDQCVSPTGEIRFCTHSGNPDWGTGPSGKGQIWRMRYKDTSPQPVMTWRHSPNEVRVAFDRELPDDWDLAETKVIAGPHTRAGDRFETMRPPYEVVKRQQADGARVLEVVSSERLDSKQISIKTESLADATWLGIELPGGYSLQADSSGVLAEQNGITRRLPHLDLDVAREFSQRPIEGGKMTLRTQLDLWQMLQPAVQRGAQLDYEYPPERVTITIASTTSIFTLKHAGEKLSSTRGHVTHDVSFTVSPEQNKWLPIEIVLEEPSEGIPQLTAYWSTSDDPRHRAFPLRRFLMPWAKPPTSRESRMPARPEIAGANWNRGKAIFHGEVAICSTCHQRDGEGVHIGPDLTNLPHRDYASVLHDILQPSASINPDYPTHEVKLTTGEAIIGVPIAQPDGSVRLGIGPGSAMPIGKAKIVSSKPVASSLMPADLVKDLAPDELRDLMAYLLTERPVMRDYPTLPKDGVDHPPAQRTRAELDAVLVGAPDPPVKTKPIKLGIIAGKKDHGFGAHDYPRFQHVWSRLLNLAKDTEVSTAWEWPSPAQWESADILVFFKRGDWTPDRIARLRKYIEGGGGAVFIHWACEAGGHAPELSEVIGLAGNAQITKYRHGVIDLTFDSGSTHPIIRGFDKTSFHDETYWALLGDLGRFKTLATATEDGADHPQFWVRELGKGRIFVSIPGHYSWTFDDPLFRTLLLRGMAWTAGEPVDRFNNLIEAGLIIR